MLPAVEHYAELVDAQLERILPRVLRGITDAELDWRPEGAGNSVRWLLGHLLWYERWAPDAVEITGRFLEDRDPVSLPVPDLDAWRTGMAAASARRRQVFGAVDAAGMEREFDYLGRGTYSVGRLVRTHAAHQTGHIWQVRYVRGAYTRAFGTDKSRFDPW